METSQYPPLTDAQIEDGIERWNTDLTDDRPLHEYLGLTWTQYAAWASHPSSRWWEAQ